METVLQQLEALRHPAGRGQPAEPEPGTLSQEQLKQLRDFKIQTRIENEKYLRTHKEVSLLISGFFREMFLKRPDNILEFAAHYFTDPRLPNRIYMQLIKDKKRA